MHCPNCGTQVDDGTKFCGNCGTQLCGVPSAVSKNPALVSEAEPAVIY